MSNILWFGWFDKYVWDQVLVAYYMLDSEGILEKPLN